MALPCRGERRHELGAGEGECEGEWTTMCVSAIVVIIACP